MNLLGQNYEFGEHVMLCAVSHCARVNLSHLDFSMKGIIGYLCILVGEAQLVSASTRLWSVSEFVHTAFVASE